MFSMSNIEMRQIKEWFNMLLVLVLGVVAGFLYPSTYWYDEIYHEGYKDGYKDAYYAPLHSRTPIEAEISITVYGGDTSTIYTYYRPKQDTFVYN